MTREPKVSVIVPIYKVEKFIHKAIDSILNQTLKDIEIILVDDGSPDNCGKICDEYAQKDSRIKVIHQKNGGLGNAYNNGIKAASGEYIGFVEPDDWIEPEMYEKLYANTNHNKCDIVKCFYTSILENGEKRLEKNFYDTDCNKFISGRGNCPNLIEKHVSHWSAIYNKYFLNKNKILFNETPGAASQDFGFILKCYAYAETVYIIPSSYINYRLFSGNHNIEHLNKNMLQECILTCNFLLNDKNIPSIVWENIYKRIAMRLVTEKTFSFTQICNLKKILRKIEKLQTYKFFSEKDKKIVTKFISKKIINIVYILQNEYTVYFLNIPVFKKKIEPNKTKKYFLGIPYKTCKQKNNKIKKYFLGIKYKTKDIPSTVQDIVVENTRLLHIISQANIVQATHQKTFSSYKNKYKDREVVLVASGPTNAKYKPIKNAVHVGVNRSFLKDNILLDYLFIQDKRAFNDGYKDKIINYKGNNCKKFFGISNEKHTDWIIPESWSIKANAVRYYTDLGYNSKFAYDLTSQHLGDFASVVFAALQFILWTSPKKIYLVGCDCTNDPYAYDKTKTTDLIPDRNIENFKKFKQFKTMYYPETEIISINPIGLKGLFTDEYTE